MLQVFFAIAISLSSCMLMIEPPRGVMYYEYDLNDTQTICFYSEKYFYVMIHNFKHTVVSADYVKKKDSEVSLKSIYFDSSNCSATNPFIDFGNYSGLVGVTATKDTVFRLETIVLDEKCKDDITVTNSATDTFVIYPESNQQCVFPFPRCKTLSVNFFPTFPENNGNIVVYESPNSIQHTITSNYQKDYTNPFYFIINIDKRSSDSYVLFTYTGSGCIRGTKRISTQISTFDKRLKAPLSHSTLVGIIVGSIFLVIIIAVIVVYLVIKKRNLQENSKTEDISKPNDQEDNISNVSESESLEDLSNLELDYLRSNNTYDSNITYNNSDDEYSTESSFDSVDPIIDNTPSYFYQNSPK